MKKFVAILCLLTLCCSLCACNHEELLTLKTQPVSLYVYIDDTLSTAQAKAIGPKLSQISDIQSVQFVSAEEAFDDFMQSHAGAEDAFSGLDASVLRNRFLVTAITPDKEALIATIRDIPGVAKVSEPFNFVDDAS